MKWKTDQPELCWHDVVNMVVMYGATLMAILAGALDWLDISPFQSKWWWFSPLVVAIIQKLRAWYFADRNYMHEQEYWHNHS